MTDRELLELAAKAAGYKADFTQPYEIEIDSTWIEWDPLTDDGDALRLAVKLGITIDTTDGVHVMYSVMGCAYPITEYEFDDICVATRRAIVRAAAEIGRSL